MVPRNSIIEVRVTKDCPMCPGSESSRLLVLLGMKCDTKEADDASCIIGARVFPIILVCLGV